MVHSVPKPVERDEEALYDITIMGHLDPSWSCWLQGLAIEPSDQGQTLLAGPIRDQAALHGLLNKIRDLGLPLLGVQRRERGSSK